MLHITVVKKMTDECIELKNIKYKTMLMGNGYTENTVKTKKKVDTLDDIINQQNSTPENGKPWSKLDKVTRLLKLSQYVDKLVTDGKIEQGDVGVLNKYLKQCLERKKLQRVKDVTFDKTSGEITNIPGLHITLTEKKKFTLKNTDKKTSTIKNLTRIKKRRKRKNKKKEGEKET